MTLEKQREQSKQENQQKLAELVGAASALRNKSPRDTRTMREIQRIERRIDDVRGSLGYRGSAA